MSNKIYLVVILTFLIHACKTNNNSTSYLKGCGTVENVLLQVISGLTSLQKPELEIKSKIWFKDSFAIEEILSIKTEINNNIEKTEFIKEYYRFNNLRTRMIYLFKHFSDTAVCYKKYSFDAGIEVEAGWGFNFERKLEYDGIPKIMNDTIIYGVTYKRLLLTIKNKNSSPYNICYFRCDKNIYPFNLNIPLSEKVGYPLVKIQYMDSTLENTALIAEVKFTADTLSPQEINVFQAWEKNILKY